MRDGRIREQEARYGAECGCDVLRRTRNINVACVIFRVERTQVTGVDVLVQGELMVPSGILHTLVGQFAQFKPVCDVGCTETIDIRLR